MGMTDPKAAVGGGRGMPFKNTSGEEVPAYGVVQFDDTELINGSIVWKIKKPGADSNVANVAFNGPTKVAANGFGSCTYDAPCRVLYEYPPDVAVGDTVGPKSGSFYISADGSGFEVLGGIDTTSKWCLIGKSGGGGGDGVAFQITAISSGVATCTILARDNPKTSSPGEIYPDVIEVEDLTGCFFDESPESALVDRKGFARYMKIVGQTDAKWIVHSLCCPPE
jgi:hypothetical protein